MLSSGDVFGLTFAILIALTILIAFISASQNKQEARAIIAGVSIVGIIVSLLAGWLTAGLYQKANGSTYKQFGYAFASTIVLYIGIILFVSSAKKDTYDGYTTKNLTLLLLSGGCGAGAYFLLKELKKAG